MRILELTWEYPPHIVGGIGSHMAALAPALRALGPDVCLLTPYLNGGSRFEEADGVRIYRIEPPVLANDFFVDVQQTNLELTAAVERLMAQDGPYDIIHAHDWLVALSAITLKQRYKIPLVATIHATERGRWRGNISTAMSHSITDMEWWLTYEAWRVIATSRFMATELYNYFALPPNKIKVVPNGVDTRPFDALDHLDLSDFRLRFAAPDEQIVFYVGRLVHEKGAHLLVEAAPRVIAAQPQTRFVIAGKGPLAETLQARVAALGIAAQVEFTGFISDEDRNKLYRVCDCAVFPSLYEPFGIVALEAMAAKAPLVVASAGGLAEFVQHHETGITVYPDSVDSLVYGLLHALQHPDWARARAQKAYALVAQRYNWRQIAERTLQEMERIVEERKSVDW